MNYTLFDLFLNAYNGNSFAQLQIVQRFQPLLKKYAALLKYEDAYSDLQLYLLELLHSGKLTKLQRKDDGTLVKYIESSIRHQYISLNSRKNAVDNSVIASVDEIDFDQMSLSSNDEYNRFARADLERRLLMIDDDMDMNALPKTNYIKTIVTAEAKLDLERKGVQSYQRDIYARFLCFGNGALTSLYDHSDGFFRRQLILTTKDKPTDRMDDPFLVEKMCAELEGILLWCLEGLHRLVQNDFRFTVSERAAANVDTIKRSSNNVIDFMESEGYFRFKADYSISSKEFYDIYKQWCEDNACHSVSAIRFSAELRQNDRRYNLEATNNIYLPGGRRVRGFVGIEPLVHPCP